MNTAPMTPTPDTWHEMPVTSFPALVQCSDDTYEILYGSFIMPGKHAIRWQQFVAPPAPKPDAFKQWCESRNLKFFGETHLGSDIWQAATAAERSRFAEGVERILRAHDVDVPLQFLRDLRALAKGDK